MKYMLFDSDGNLCGELNCEPNDLGVNTPDGCTAYKTEETLSDVRLIDGIVTPIPKSELDEVSENEEAFKLRLERDELLSASDWTQVSDAPVDQAAWATYRQALRDVTDQDGFPDNVVWPSQP